VRANKRQELASNVVFGGRQSACADEANGTHMSAELEQGDFGSNGHHGAHDAYGAKNVNE
jgi:hypothetical protein